MLGTLKAQIKKILATTPKDFDAATLPWIDTASSAEISNFVKNNPVSQELSYDLEEKLRFWQKNGYVIFEKAIADSVIDTYLSDVESLISNHQNYQSLVRVDLPEYAQMPVKPIADVPESVLRGHYLKIMDFHNSSVAGKKLMLHPAITTFLNAIWNQQTVAMQSLTFMHGSQQATHQDFAYVVSQIPSHLAASWIALEDINQDSGPLYYYKGSHKIKKFNFGNGIFLDGQSTKNPNDFAAYLDAECKRLGLEKETLLINKGDVLIWHAALAHGGNAIKNDELTRKSYVSHYSSVTAYHHHRLAMQEEPKRLEYNNAVVFANPTLPNEEDIFKAGLTL